MFKHLIATAVISLAVNRAHAQEINPYSLAECMMAHSGESEVNTMMRALVAIMTDDAAGLTKGLGDYMAVILRISMNECGVTFDQLEGSKDVDSAMEQYGSMLAEKVLTDAFKKLN